MMQSCSFFWLILSINTFYAQQLTLSAGYSSLPKPLYGSYITVNSQNEVILIGGCDSYTRAGHLCYSDYMSSNIYVWDTSNSAQFTEITTLNQLNAWNPSVGYPFPIHKDIMYIPWYNTIHKYDTINKNWLDNNSTTPIPIPLYYPCTVFDKTETKIYLLGGYVGGNEAKYYGSLQIYHIKSNSWESYTNIAQMPYSIYGGSCVLTNDRKIYYFGGKIDGTSSKIFRYDIDENIWSELTTKIPEWIFGSSVVLVNETKIFISGGGRFYGGSTVKRATQNVYLFDTMYESISIATAMNSMRYAPMSTVVNGRIWIGGGMTVGDFSFDYGVLSDTQISHQIWMDEDDRILSTTQTTGSMSMQTTISNNINISNTEQIKATINSSVDSNQAVGYGSNVNQDLVIAVVVLCLVIIVMIIIFILVRKYFQCSRKGKMLNIPDEDDVDEENKQYKRVEMEGGNIFGNGDVDNQVLNEINTASFA